MTKTSLSKRHISRIIFVSLVLTTCTPLISTATGNEDLEPTEVIEKMGEQEREIEIDEAAEILKPTDWTVELWTGWKTIYHYWGRHPTRACTGYWIIDWKDPSDQSRRKNTC